MSTVFFSISQIILSAIMGT